MAYIYLDELKEILPDIMSEKIWMDDKSWELIFQEIEQKCHVGKRKKDKKKWKTKIESKINEHSAFLSVHKDDITELFKKVDTLDGRFHAIEFRVDSMGRDIGAAKSMAQTAKQRTDVDCTKCSKEKSDADVVQNVYNRMAGRGATREELDIFRNLIQKYDALEKKEIPVVKKVCVTCKYFRDKPKFDNHPCNACNGNDKWEAKDE
jgi:outer membrane murein-binding lipoprotein Lpp